ncbi:MAG: type II toxin-antitoxin system VapC family toxin [Cyanobacteria bacterium J06555_13]
MSKVFLDTSYALALSFRSDVSHLKAKQIAQLIDQDRILIVTTRAILLEIGNALSKQRFRHQGITLLTALEEEPLVKVVSMSDGLYHRAFDLFRTRSDKGWGLVDCLSCVVMQDEGIDKALTADRHFQQMGFRALLCENYP